MKAVKPAADKKMLIYEAQREFIMMNTVIRNAKVYP